MNFLCKKLIDFLNCIQNIFKLFQLIFVFVGIIIVFYWIVYQVPMAFFQNIAGYLGVIVEPLVYIFKMFYTFTTIHRGQPLDITPVILSGGVFVLSYIFEFSALIINRTSAKIFRLLDDYNLKIEENEKQQILDQIRKETLKFNKLHFHLNFYQVNNDIAELADEGDGENIKKALHGIIKHSVNFESYNTLQIGSGFSYILSFKSKSGLINFINFIKEQLKELNNEISFYGIYINFKGAIDCSREAENPDTITFLRKIVRFCGHDEIMISTLMKKYLEYDLKASLAYEINGKGIYTTETDTIELFNLQLIKPIKCKQY